MNCISKDCNRVASHYLYIPEDIVFEKWGKIYRVRGSKTKNPYCDVHIEIHKHYLKKCKSVIYEEIIEEII